MAVSGAMGSGRRGEGGGVVALEGFQAEKEESKKRGHNGERRALKGLAEEGTRVGSGSGPRGGRWMVGCVPVRRGLAALSEATARAHGGGRLANRGGRRGVWTLTGGSRRHAGSGLNYFKLF
jgi:hypothetical protein